MPKIGWNTQPVGYKDRVLIKGDAGEYEAWGVDWLNQTICVYRASEYEWIPFRRIKSISPFPGSPIEIGQVFSIGGTPTCVFDIIERNSTHGYNGEMVALEVNESRLDENTYWWRPYELRSGDPDKVVVIIPIAAFMNLASENGYKVFVKP